MTVTRFCFIRHGETAWNTQRRLQGQLDIGLNENGEGQARAVGRWLARRGGIDVIHSSDLSRAWRTAGHVGMALGLTPLPAPGLRERRYGVFEGLTYTEAREWHPEHYARLEAREPDFVIPDGESLRQFHDRVTAGLETLLERHRGQTLVVVVHGGVLDIINRFVRGNSLSAPRDFLIPNTGLNWVVQDRDGWHIEAWGETPHLEAGALDELR
ncbi:MAG: histidine phosphatase family protein [Azovibrio sp.]|uniref:histidine phosphatase family protein n=1 Tax=Azovibrio sp. TaxID=1872673 RepID=UPI003C78290A